MQQDAFTHKKERMEFGYIRTQVQKSTFVRIYISKEIGERKKVE
jgi:hypothetical protein